MSVVRDKDKRRNPTQRRKIEKEKEVMESDEDENFGSVGSNPNNKKKINKKGEASDKSSEEPLTSGKDKNKEASEGSSASVVTRGPGGKLSTEDFVAAYKEQRAAMMAITKGVEKQSKLITQVTDHLSLSRKSRKLGRER